MLHINFWKVLWFNVRYPSQAHVFERLVPNRWYVLGYINFKCVTGIQALGIIALLCFHFALLPAPLRVKGEPITTALATAMPFLPWWILYMLKLGAKPNLSYDASFQVVYQWWEKWQTQKDQSSPSSGKEFCSFYADWVVKPPGL